MRIKAMECNILRATKVAGIHRACDRRLMMGELGVPGMSDTDEVTKVTEASEAAEATDIVDWASFDRRTSGKRAVSGLLFYKELDCLIDLAHCISLDFFDRPQLYRDVGDDVVRDLTELRARYGYREDFLSREQRHQILTGIFGADEDALGADSFSALRDQLLAAVAAFVERVFNTSEQMLRAAVRIMHVYIKDYLQDVTGASVGWSRTVGFPAINARSYRILRDPQIAGRFGVNREPGIDWPVAVDANGSKLVEQISGTLMRVQTEHISRGVFNDKQQLALRGAEALAAIIDYGGGPDAASIDLLITRCYTWYAARGRVLRLPVAVSPPASVALDVMRPASRAAIGATDSNVPGSTPPALEPSIELQPTNGYGNRSLFGTATPELRR
jgi:hypothetical protein